MQNTFVNAVNILARAKLVRNAKHRSLYRLMIAFNVYETTEQFGKTVYKFPVQKKCDYVSGDIELAEVPNVIARAEKVLRTNNIQLVG